MLLQLILLRLLYISNLILRQFHLKVIVKIYLSKVTEIIFIKIIQYYRNNIKTILCFLYPD